MTSQTKTVLETRCTQIAKISNSYITEFSESFLLSYMNILLLSMMCTYLALYYVSAFSIFWNIAIYVYSSSHNFTVLDTIQLTRVFIRHIIVHYLLLKRYSTYIGCIYIKLCTVEFAGFSAIFQLWKDHELLIQGSSWGRVKQG